MLQPGEGVEEGGKNKEYGGGNQTRGTSAETGPLDGAHNGVHGSAHPVGGEAANESIKLGGGRANAQEEGYLNKEDERCRDTTHIQND